MPDAAARRLANRRFNEAQKLRAALLNQIGTALPAAAVFVPIFNGGGRALGWLATLVALVICALLWYTANAQLVGLRSED